MAIWLRHTIGQSQWLPREPGALKRWQYHWDGLYVISIATKIIKWHREVVTSPIHTVGKSHWLSRKPKPSRAKPARQIFAKAGEKGNAIATKPSYAKSFQFIFIVALGIFHTSTLGISRQIPAPAHKGNLKAKPSRSLGTVSFLCWDCAALAGRSLKMFWIGILSLLRPYRQLFGRLRLSAHLQIKGELTLKITTNILFRNFLSICSCCSMSFHILFSIHT